MSEPLDYCTFMKGMCNAPGNRDLCEECYGIGLVAKMCCGGFECGCRGMPIDFVKCKCGAEEPTDEQIKIWSEIK